MAERCVSSTSLATRMAARQVRFEILLEAHCRRCALACCVFSDTSVLLQVVCCRLKQPKSRIAEMEFVYGDASIISCPVV